MRKALPRAEITVPLYPSVSPIRVMVPPAASIFSRADAETPCTEMVSA